MEILKIRDFTETFTRNLGVRETYFSCDYPVDLIDNSIDIKQLISQDQQDINKSFHFQGDIQQLVFQLLEQGNHNTMSHITQSHSGSGDNVARDKNTTNTYNSQDLTQAAADIQALLEQLEETYSANTFSGKVAIANEAIERIDNDPKLAPRILSALSAGGTSALDSLLDHPAASFVIGALEDWQQTRGS